jgi:hypothetical protein
MPFFLVRRNNHDTPRPGPLPLSSLSVVALGAEGNYVRSLSRFASGGAGTTRKRVAGTVTGSSG